MQRVGVDPETVARLVHTANILGRIDDPGVERIIGLERDPDRVRMVTAFAGGRSLRTIPVTDVGGAAAEVCATLARLHESGITHGPVTASQIMLDANDRPVLRDFTGGHLRSDEDNSSWQRSCAGDVRSVGVLVADLLARVDTPLGRRSGYQRRIRRVTRRLVDGTVTDAHVAEGELRRAVRGHAAAGFALDWCGGGRASTPAPGGAKLGRAKVGRAALVAVSIVFAGHFATYRFNHRIPPSRPPSTVSTVRR